MSAANAIRALLLIFGAVLAWRLFSYVFTVGQPFAYYKDLGVNFITISYATHDIHSLRDFADSLSWAPWYDQPLFNLNPYLSYAIAVPLGFVLGNAWFTVKVVQLLEFAAAFASMYWLCRELLPRRLLAAPAALTYAMLPATALAIRGNLDMGWTAVGAPLALACGIALLRRFRLHALPLAALCCSLFGFCIAIEYLIFVSAPLYVVLAVAAYDARRKAAWAVSAGIGLVALLSTGAYFLLPSVLSTPFSDSSTRVSQLVSGSILPLFSETWDAFSGFVPRESLVSPVAVYNATPGLWIAQIAGCILALLAIAGIVRFRKELRTGSLEWCLLIVGVFLAYLTLGTYAPLGDRVWEGIGSMPFLDAVRTPDRFIVLPALVAIVWGFRALGGLSLSRFAWAAPAVLAVMFTCFAGFDLSQHCFQNQPTMGTAEPDILQVNHIAEQLGPRTVSFGLVNGGSPFDYPSYGVPTDTAPAFTDWESRYVEDGIGAVGLMQRIGVHSVIATPMWAGADAQDFPNTSAIYRTLPLAPVVFDSAQDVIVARMPAPAAPVRPVTQACLRGGPGLLDQLLAMPAFGATAMNAGAACSAPATVLENYSPYDAVQQPQTAAWVPGAQLFPGTQLRDADYAFFANRVLLKDAWYRNSIDGDTLDFDPSGASLIDGPASATVPFSTSAAGAFDVLVRMAVHTSGTLDASIDGGATQQSVLHAQLGMRWYRFPIARLSAGAHSVQLRFVQAKEKMPDSGWRGVALDGVAVVPHGVLNALTSASLRQAASVVSLDRVAAPNRSNAAEAISLAPDADGLQPFQRSGAIADRDKGRAIFEATEPEATLAYRYSGGAGMRVIRLSAFLAKAGETISAVVLHAGTQVASKSVVAHLDNARETLALEARLSPGDVISVGMASPFLTAGAGAQLTGGSVSPPQSLEMAPIAAGSVSASLQFPDLPNRPLAYPWAGDLAYSPSGAIGGPQQRIVIPIQSAQVLNTLAVHANVTGQGAARMELICTGARAQRILLDSNGVALHGKLRDCRLAITWLSGQLAFTSIDAYGSYARLSGSLRVWLPAGSYHPALRSQNGETLDPSTLRIDGRSIGGTLTFAKSGFHTLSTANAPANAYLAAFLPLSWSHASPAALTFKPTGALRDVVHVRRAGSVEVEHLYDGNWLLRSGKTTVTGTRCDLLNTCFADVPAGTYELYHAYPRTLVLGLAISLLTLIVCGGLLFFAASNRQRTVLGR